MIGAGVIKGWVDSRPLQGCAIRDGVIYVARSGGLCDKYLLKGDEVEYLFTVSFHSRGE